MWKNPIPPGSPFWANSADDLFRELKSNAEGLTKEAAAERIRIPDKKNPVLREIRLFLSRFTDPMMLLLLVAVFLSALLGEGTDAFIIFLILFLSAGTTWLLHSRAGRLQSRLEAMVIPDAVIIRNGKYQRIPADQVVAGDLLSLMAGDVIPADCLLLEANELHVNESGFTGESFPIRKNPGPIPAETRLSGRLNCLWKGSNVVSGSARALVVHIQHDSLFFELSKNIAIPRVTGFEKGMTSFGYFLLRITLLLALLVLVVNVIHRQDLMDAALFSLALAVGMAPELLPAITTMAMSFGAARLLEKQVLVKDINSIQNLGEITLLCTDKTGTLTEGNIRVSGFFNVLGEEDDFVKKMACLNAVLSTGYANPMENALRQTWKQEIDFSIKTGELPYDFIRKRVSISLHEGEAQLLICKGSFHSVLDICSHVRLFDEKSEEISSWRNRLTQAAEDYGKQGLRCLLVAFRHVAEKKPQLEDEKQMTLAGFVLFQDPVKEGVLSAIESLRELKVGLKVLSGDSLPVLLALAGKIGIKEPNTMTGAELDLCSSEALRHRAETTEIFAEIDPRHKERIIQVLRKKHVLAYMGDGINDVSALHAADVGISVNNAAGIAIDAADFVLLRKDIGVLADGIREGRRTFANTLKYIYISTGATFGNMLSVAIASLFLPFIPMLPKQLLLTNFISDFPFLAVASDQVDEEQIQHAGHWKMNRIRNFMLVFGLHSSVFDLGTFYLLLEGLKMDRLEFQTAWFMESVLSEIIILFVIRTRRPFFRSRPAPALLWLGMAGMIFTILLPWLPFANMMGLAPLHPVLLAWLLLILMVYLLSAEVLKHWFFSGRKEAYRAIIQNKDKAEKSTGK